MNPEAILFLRIGLACNNRCYMCAGTWVYQANLTTAQVLRKLQRGREYGLGEVVFSGGEPTVRNDIVDLVRTAKEVGYSSIVLQTNARRLAEGDLAERLTAAGVTRYCVSLHGHNSETNDSITRVRGSFAQTLSGIRNIQHSSAESARIVVHCVILPSNFRYLLALVRLLLSLNIPMVKLSYVVPVGRASGIYRQHSQDVPSMTRTLPFLFPAVDEFLSYAQHRSRATVSIGYYPFCLVHGYERYLDDIVAPPTFLITDEGDFLPATTEIEKRKLKAKGPNCCRCTFDSVCSGLWREYPEAYGWEEFLPITDFRPEDIMPGMFRKTGEMQQ
jgi:MoaA/NifB/PqqE/SkfB family radical SAM enzyme